MVSWRERQTRLINSISDQFVDADIKLLMRQNQREVIRVDPDDAEVREVGVVSGYLLQDLQELKTVCKKINTTWNKNAI